MRDLARDRTRPALPAGFLLAAFLLLASLLLPWAPAAAAAELVPVPVPALGDLEPPVAKQLAAEQAKLDALLAHKPAASEVDLAAAFGATGELYLLYHLNQAAAACFDNAGRLAPAEFRWPYYLGVAEQEKGRLDAAANAFARALELQPGYAPGYLRLAQVEHARNRLDAAEPLARRALGAPATEAAAHFELGRIAAERKQPRVAIDELNRALALQPEASAARYPLAMAYREIGQLDEAKQHLEKRGDRAVSFADPLVRELERARLGVAVHIEQGGLALKAGRWDEAVTHFEAILTAQPDDQAALGGLGTALARLGRWEASAAAFARLAAAAPESSAGPLGQARALLRAGKEAEARAALEAATARLPADGDLAHWLARVLATASSPAVRDGRRAAALAAQVFAAAPAPEHGETLAMAYAELGRFPEAIELQGTVIETLATQKAPAEVLARARQRLAAYQRGEPCRTPWLAGG